MLSRNNLLLLSLLASVGLGTGYESTQPQEHPNLVARQDRVDVSRGGTAQSFEIASPILNESRRILIVLPPSYSSAAPTRIYPTTVVVDGEYLMPAVAPVSDELSRNGQIPESVLVGVENLTGLDQTASNNRRVFDLTPPGLSVSGSDLHQGGDRFLDFIEKELLPAVDQRFRTAAPRTFVGVSSGAVLATYVAATRSMYSAVISLDAPIALGDNWLATKLIARAQTPGRPLRYASFEAKFGWPEPVWTRLLQVAPPTWSLYREKFQLEGHETLQMLGAYLGLRQLFGDYSRLAVTDLPASSVMPHYEAIGQALGAPVVPPLRVLRDLITDSLSAGQAAGARAAYTLVTINYGRPADDERLLARIAEAERSPAPTETVEGLLATPFPTQEEAREFIGEWAGDIWMGPDEPRPGTTRLRIRVENGHVIGETIRETREGESTQRWQYMRITQKGLTWGNLNGMRPRGVALFEGVLDGDELSGQMRFGGIQLAEQPPPLHFLFKRAKR